MASLKKLLYAFVKLANPLYFDATEGQPVDLIFTLLVCDRHLLLLARLTR